MNASRRWVSMLVLSIAVAWSAAGAQGRFDDVPVHFLEGEHLVSIEGVGEFNVATAESIEVTPGEWQRDLEGFNKLPLKIVGMAGRGHAEGIGETVYWLDKNRPVDGSGVRAKGRGTTFPAVQEMKFHLLLTTESFPGRTFRSINPAVMANRNAKVFPPRLGTRYSLQQVIEFEDVDEPGTVVIRITSNQNQIVSEGRVLTNGPRPAHRN